jgi:hypothetical protein
MLLYAQRYAPNCARTRQQAPIADGRLLPVDLSGGIVERYSP